ncbi:putative ribosome biogenesis protein [Phaeomoniella chlamydospora]|uniref:Pescadillo homolog n=1 Tax=Phaeomoniella chlamydospora TaxID=158046 RepID=A0A0G2GRR7_PHACM|nr:putative ribosome biogenesis protein [Phaeomoniella chlamydospora]
MGRIKKKGTAGQAKNYITRTQAVRKLQISLPDFRRLCIFKGIYPREPRNKKKASKSSSHSTTFYYTKDIQYLLHEPLLQKFREQKALSKKIAKSLGRNEVSDAARLEKHATPKITLDHIVRERYPTFVDALRDLDDALSLLFLFANLPSTSTVPPKIIARCQRLCHEFEHYLIVSRSMRKSFLSIKGIYYQATIQGQDIMWLVPYRFVQRVSGDVDYRIMGTFVEFYATLLGFVNFRLYTSIGLVYPPKFDVAADEKGGELAAFTLEGRKISMIEDKEQPKVITNGNTTTQNSEEVQKHIDAVAKTEEPQDETQTTEDADVNSDAIDKFEAAAPEADSLIQPQSGANNGGDLFAPFTFYISREAPRHPLELLLRAFGCKRLGWDAFVGEGAYTHDEADPRITHQIVDRPPLPETSLPRIENDVNAPGRVRPGMRIPGRTYVQPQWIWDCVNEGRLLRPDLYAPGATLPPHLSPWIKPTSGQYDPRATLAEQEEEGEAELSDDKEEDDEEPDEEEQEQENAEEDESEDESVNGGMDVAETDEDEDDDEEEDEDNDFAGFDDEEADEMSEDEAEDPRTQHQKELEAEAAGVSFSSSNGATKEAKAKQSSEAKKRVKKQKEKDEELERQKLMMPRKKRKLFEKMQYSNSKRDAEALKLRSKRRKLEKGQA